MRLENLEKLRSSLHLPDKILHSHVCEALQQRTRLDRMAVQPSLCLVIGLGALSCPARHIEPRARRCKEIERARASGWHAPSIMYAISVQGPPAKPIKGTSSTSRVS